MSDSDDYDFDNDNDNDNNNDNDNYNDNDHIYGTVSDDDTMTVSTDPDLDDEIDAITDAPMAVPETAEASFHQSENILTLEQMNNLWFRLPTNVRRLINAISENPNIEEVKSLIAEGVRIDRYTPKIAWNNSCAPAHYSLLHLAIYINKLPIALLILNRFIIEGLSISTADGNGNTPLHIAAKFFCRKIIKELVDKGATINARNKNGATPFLIACRTSSWVVIRYLLAHGADIHARDNIGRGCLFYAAQGHYDNVVRKLLHRQHRHCHNDLCQEDMFGLTPLHLAVNNYQRYSTSIINLFLKNGADINKRDYEGRTPMHWTLIQTEQWAIDKSHTAVNLIRNGADLNIKNNLGQSVISLLERHEMLHDIIDLLNIDKVYQGLTSIMCLKELYIYHHLDCDSNRDLFDFS